MHREFLPAILLGLLLSVPARAGEARPDHVFLLIGQSNMVGRAPLKDEDRKPIPNCLLWNGKEWEAAQPGFNRYSKHQKPGSTQGMNGGPAFVAAYQKANPGVTVGIVCWARGGTSIEQWHPDHLEPYDLYREAIKQAQAALKQGGQLKGILWHQGEGNSGRWEGYPQLLKEHVARLRREFDNPKLPFVFGQLGQWNEKYQAFNRMIPNQVKAIPYSACVLTGGLTNFDPYHFDRNSQLELGRRYAAKMLALLKPNHRFSVTIDRGEDIGQNFGSLFEATSPDGSVTIGAGFPNAYNTRYRADRHDVQFFIRPHNGPREMTVKELPRPSGNLTGTYLYGREGKVYSTYGGLGFWNTDKGAWERTTGPGGKEEAMRVGSGVLGFGESKVTWDGEVVLSPPKQGSYQLFFYANGHLCFYHVHRDGKPYHPYENDEDGFSRLYACPWKPSDGKVDLGKAITLRLPIVGETTFAWGLLGEQIVTGSNIGGFYVFEDGAWRMILAPKLGVSFQLYSSLAFNDRLLLGQYPTGRVWEYDGRKLTDLKGWPPVMPGVSGSAREAQTTTLYGGEVLVGVWPWGEVWRYNPSGNRWTFGRRFFSHPDLSKKITHPYDVENEGNVPRNLWGQRITSLITSGSDLFVGTSNKSPRRWDPKLWPFLAPDKWQDYGKVYRVTMPGHLSAPTKWTRGKTTFVFNIRGSEMSIRQDGAILANARLGPRLAGALSGVEATSQVKWGAGIYGPHRCVSLEGRQ
ncbi:MAG: hypothetical protein CMO80_22550 [Verrucomicrobiales bacterium]|nr:hypothetical protein [Verrucomicrobiales bacterium]|tara:strand:+ start:18227 stop:20464 length:2238 start_codon:yes stop_codon:yes gene_type:complete